MSPRRSRRAALLRRHYLTLLELVVVLLLLSLAIGVVGINLAKMSRLERFRVGTALLVDRLQLAQDLMIIFKADVRVDLQSDPRGLTLEIAIESGQVSGALERSLRPIQIQGIRFLAFTDSSGRRQSGAAQLKFRSQGTDMSAGVLTVAAGEDPSDPTRYLRLAGYPQVISSAATAEALLPPPQLSSRLYPIEVLEREQRRHAR